MQYGTILNALPPSLKGRTFAILQIGKESTEMLS